MVNKSNVVSKFSKTFAKIFSRSDDGKCDCDQVVNDDEKRKNKNNFVIQMNEMVKTKPSPTTMKGLFFQSTNNKSSAPDNSSPSSIFSNFWSSMSSNIRSKRASIDESLDHYITESRLLLIKILAACISIALIGFIISSSLHSRAHHHSHQLLINKTIKNDSSYNGSAVQHSPPTTDVADYDDAIFNDSGLNSSPDISSTQNEHQLPRKHFNEEIAFTKSYAERINFYTTLNKNLFSVKVMPTLPSIGKKQTTLEASTTAQNYANDCESTSLPLCQGILSYDLTHNKRNLTNIEYQHFEHLVNSNCSNRVNEYICQMLEPECRPSQMESLKPCRRICKGIFESCSHIIASSEVLTEFFDCNSFVDSNDDRQCEDITKKRKHCYDDEFQCLDMSCIPIKWRCDNLSDCPKGDDEDECKFCNYDEFKCFSDQQCISEKWHCDGSIDCEDGSDESNCDISEDYDGNVHEISSYYDEDDVKCDYCDDDLSAIDDDDKIVSTGDGIVPIFVNPNTTSTSSDEVVSDAAKQVQKRFRSTMRKVAMTTTEEMPKNIISEKTSTIAPKMTSYSTSHTSPCPENHLRCIDGLCITLNQICDKIQDCSDNSDELHCEY